MATERNDWLDNTKFILIVCVVLGHCLERLGVGATCYCSNSTMAFFRMPMFVFISGLFSRKKNKTRFLDFLSGITESYIIFSTLHIICGLISGGSFSIMQFIEPRWTLWYLLCVVIWRSIIQVSEGKISPSLLLVFSVIVGLLSGFVPFYSILSLQRAFSFAPFFFLGYFCSCNKVDLRFLKKLHPLFSIACFLLLIVICLICYKTSFPLSSFLMAKHPYSFFANYPIWLVLVFRIMMYIICTIASVCMFSIIPEKRSWMSEEGKNTLLYYLYHPFFILGLSFLGKRIDLPSSLLACVVYTVLIIWTIRQVIKIKFFRDIPKLFTKLFSLVSSNSL